MRKELKMELPPISPDDLTDMVEMTEKLKNYIEEVLDENERNLAMSALMSAFINSVFGQCETLDEILSFRNCFMQILDSSIRSIQIKGRE